MVSLFSLAVPAVELGFSPFLKYVIPEALPWSDAALASVGSVLELTGIDSVGRGRIFLQIFIEPTPAALCNQNHLA